MPLENLILIIFLTVILTSVFYANLDNFSSFFQKITGYTTIVIYGTVEAPQTNISIPQENTLTATVKQPQKEESGKQVSTTETHLVISETVEPQEQKQYVNQTLLLQVIKQTEDLKIKLDNLRTSSRNVLKHYSSINNTKNTEKWINVIVLFNQAVAELEDIQTYAETTKDSATKENVTIIKDMITDVIKTTNKIVKLIKDE